jgi:hypothetical protein
MLRKALGASAIETVSKRGYRLATEVKPVVEAPVTPESPKTPELAPPAAPARSIKPARAYRLSRQGLGPLTMFPVSGLDFWRLPAAAIALALAVAIGIGAADLILLRG